MDRPSAHHCLFPSCCFTLQRPIFSQRKPFRLYRRMGHWQHCSLFGTIVCHDIRSSTPTHLFRNKSVLRQANKTYSNPSDILVYSSSSTFLYLYQLGGRVFVSSDTLIIIYFRGYLHQSPHLPIKLQLRHHPIMVSLYVGRTLLYHPYHKHMD